MDVNLSSKLDNRILWIVKILLGFCLVTTLFISSGLLFPYTAPKAFAFRIAIEIAALFYFYLALKYRPLRPKANVLVWSVLIFFAANLFSAVFGVDWYLSFWGNLERMLGFWGILHFVLFFLMLSAVFKTKSEWLALLKISVLASFLIAAIALLQKFWNLGLLLPQSERVFSVIGNAAFLASYLIFNMFFAVYLLWREIILRRLWWLTIWGAGLFFQILTLFYTGTRGALLGLAGGVTVCLILFSFFCQVKKIRRYFLLGLAGILISAALFFVFRNNSFIQQSPILERLTSISFKDATVQNRLILWRQAWIAWQERPIFGWGAENYEVAINKYFDPRLSPYEAWYDRAHNFIFDYGVSGGWLGLVSFLVLFGAAFWCLKKNRLKKPAETGNDKEMILKSSGAIIFCSLIVAYLIQNFFVFDVFVSYLMLFFLLALINFFYTPNSYDKSEQGGSVPISASKKIAVIGFALLVFSSIYYLNIKPMQASFLASQILSLRPEDQGQRDLLFGDALSKQTFAFGEIAYQVTFDYLSKINSDPRLTQNENFYKLASGGLEKNINRSPLQSRNYVALAWLDLYFSDEHRERIENAIGLAQKLRILSPAKKDAYLLLVAAYSVSNNNQEAQKILEQAQKIDVELGSEVRQYWESLNKN